MEKFLTLASAALFSVAQLAVTHGCPIPHHTLAVGLTRHTFTKGELCNHTAKRVSLWACRALVEDIIHLTEHLEIKANVVSKDPKLAQKPEDMSSAGSSKLLAAEVVRSPKAERRDLAGFQRKNRGIQKWYISTHVTKWGADLSSSLCLDLQCSNHLFSTFTTYSVFPCPFRDTCTQAHIIGCSPSPSVAPSVFTLVTPGARVASIARAAPIPSDAAVAFPMHTVTLCKGSPDKPSALQLPGSARGSRNTLASCPGTWHPDFPLIIH